jgi:hypothetical protein
MREEYYSGDVINVGEDLTSLEHPYSATERSLVVKRDRALEKAAKRAKLTWKDKKELRKSTSRNLLELTQQTSEDLKDAIVAKFRSDLNLFVTAHNMRNMASLERLKLTLENALTEAYAESCKERMNTKMRVLLSTIEKAERKIEDLKRYNINGNSNGKHANAVLESFERLFHNAVREIESISVRMNHPHYSQD